MGNCQAAEISAVVIQHPDGKTERMYWPTTAEDVMKSHPGHHVALLTLCIAQDNHLHSGAGAGDTGGRAHVRFTRVRLLKPKDMLFMGQVYRLLSSQEVSKAMQARKVEKMKRAQSELIKQQRQQMLQENRDRDQVTCQLAEPSRTENQERDRSSAAAAAASAAGGRARHWRPKLQSISEGMG